MYTASNCISSIEPHINSGSLRLRTWVGATAERTLLELRTKRIGAAIGTQQWSAKLSKAKQKTERMLLEPRDIQRWVDHVLLYVIALTKLATGLDPKLT